jgi:hypothetical protein
MRVAAYSFHGSKIDASVGTHASNCYLRKSKRMLQLGRLHVGGGGMAVGMQIRYLGFVGSPAIESEAGAQLLRLAPFGELIRGCHLAIEAFHDAAGARLYDARLDLITLDYSLVPIEHSTTSDPLEGILHAFDGAVRELENTILRAKPKIVTRSSARL